MARGEDIVGKLQDSDACTLGDLGDLFSPLGCPIEKQDQGHPSQPGKHGNKRVADFPKGQRWLMGVYHGAEYIVSGPHHI